MAMVICKYSRSKINQSGEALVRMDPKNPQREEHLEVVANWRACHSWPLLTVKNLLKQRAESVGSSVLVAQRIKRLPSILLKLSQTPGMQLARMQDIGGCRAVMSNVSDVDRLLHIYETAKPRGGACVKKIKNYIDQPKEDGYRSVHVILDFHSRARPQYDGQKIEIQIRTHLQHLWATAIETTQSFTGYALKSRIKQADPAWERFFRLMSSAFAIREKGAAVPGTPTESQELASEMKSLDHDHGILATIAGWQVFTDMEQDRAKKSKSRPYAYLLTLDVARKKLQIMEFPKEQEEIATDVYMQREKDAEGHPNIQVVLVSADTLAKLQRAYPNYYVDMSKFISEAKREIELA